MMLCEMSRQIQLLKPCEISSLKFEDHVTACWLLSELRSTVCVTFDTRKLRGKGIKICSETCNSCFCYAQNLRALAFPRWISHLRFSHFVHDTTPTNKVSNLVSALPASLPLFCLQFCVMFLAYRCLRVTILHFVSQDSGTKISLVNP